MSNPILTVFDDNGNAIAIPAFPWVTEGGGGRSFALSTKPGFCMDDEVIYFGAYTVTTWPTADE